MVDTQRRGVYAIMYVYWPGLLMGTPPILAS